MGTTIAILIGGALLFYIIFRHRKLVSDGKIIDRERNFVEKVEDFILTSGAYSEVSKRIQELPYREMKVSMGVADGGQTFMPV